MATVYTQFTPSATASPPFSFNPTLDGQNCTVNLTWNVFGERWYISAYDNNGDLMSFEPLVESPDGEDIPMMPGILSSTTFVYRESSNNFEVTN